MSKKKKKVDEVVPTSKSLLVLTVKKSMESFYTAHLLHGEGSIVLPVGATIYIKPAALAFHVLELPLWTAFASSNY